MGRKRLDQLMVEKELAESRSLAQRLVMSGKVRVNGETVLRPAQLVDTDRTIEILSPPRFVSRGGEKLEAAIEAFGIKPEGWICADVGASTGGFTDCLLQHQARTVYAIDVGYGQLDWKLRQDERVVVYERTNARNLITLPQKVDLVTIDASFISLKVLLPVVLHWLQPDGGIIALIKPQFEAGRAEVSRGEGVITDPAIHERIVMDIQSFCSAVGLAVVGVIESPLKGPKGNKEYLLYSRVK